MDPHRTKPLIQVLTLEDGQFNESSLFIFEKGWSIKIVPGASLFKYERIKIFTDYPVANVKSFSRDTFHEVPINHGGELVNNIVGQSMNWRAEIEFNLPGSYHYYFVDDGEAKHNEKLGSGYFQVRPKLPRPLETIQCQTVISKNLGQFTWWRDTLRVSSEAGFNMIHLTPCQELGGSGSCYSIADQLQINSSFTPDDSSSAIVNELNNKKNGKLSMVDELENIVKFMWEKHETLTITDIVLNHTANESKWILQQPECAYNCQNSPHLRPAYLFDRAVLYLGYDMMNYKWFNTHSLGDRVNSEEDLGIIRMLLSSFYLPPLRLHQLFQVDVKKSVQEFEQFLQRHAEKGVSHDEGPLILQDPLYRRLMSRVDYRVAMRQVNNRLDFERMITQENQRIKERIDDHLAAALNNIISAIRYEFLEKSNPSDDPDFSLVSHSKPLVAPYFEHVGHPNERTSLSREEEMMYNAGQYCVAHNGWVMNYDSSKNFAAEGSNIYLRRELIAWGDCIKLRYGDKPEDCPFLWNHMRKYVEQQAKIFHGIRLDNCHSTPVHVAQYMLDAARIIKPDLYIIAELFTSNEEADNRIVNKLGITSLIREAMAAPNCREFGAMMYRFGGVPVGAFYHPPGNRPLKPSVAHAILYDQTHDNEALIVKRSPYDVTATSAIVSMACCATGSTRGFDEMVPHQISVVSEKRRYQYWITSQLWDGRWPLCYVMHEGEIDFSRGILELRSIINMLHKQMYWDGYTEIFVDQVSEDVLAITRHNPENCQMRILLARTAFDKQVDPNDTGAHIKPITIHGNVGPVIFEAIMSGDSNKAFNNFALSENFINGISEEFKLNILSKFVEVSDAAALMVNKIGSDLNEVKSSRFLPSYVAAFETTPNESQSIALKKCKYWVHVKQKNFTEVPEPIKNLSLDDVNYILYGCDYEHEGDNVYELPNYGKFPYCGLQGFMYILSRVRDQQDQGHPLCDNLRGGNWLIDYTLARLKRRESIKEFYNFIKGPLEAVKLLPRAVVPRYFDMITASVYNAICDHKSSLMLGRFVATGPRFVKKLAIASLALVGKSASAPLAPWSKPSEKIFPDCVSIAAGLPHFAHGYMRNWGRDTFISLRGLMLLTERFDEAKSIILSYAATLRHGLIPNLLHEGSRARYNCRDAVWWWLYSIKEYMDLVPKAKALELLEEPVRRIYPYSHSEPQMEATESEGRVQPLCAIMHEAIQCHFDGIDFIERNAGKEIDEHMDIQGFSVSVYVDRETGFVCGGNRFNCGTWMDKMGSSLEASNKGVPASPRDGAAVEIVGLSYAVVKWLEQLYKRSWYRYKGVCSTIKQDQWTWEEWSAKIEQNFERHFWIDETTELSQCDQHYVYKDLAACQVERDANMFRPNFLIAMVVADKLFKPDNARLCLEKTKELLVGPLGMRTLDPTSPYYNGYYDNAEQSSNYSTAQGFNYHHGPEWLWLTGFYLRAVLKFTPKNEKILYQQDIKHVKEIIGRHYKHIESNAWLGLPELTNRDGQPCKDSCPIQAWSIATMMEAVYDLSKLQVFSSKSNA